ncbi:MAG: L-histidine N(alpha)-methyltransferase [Kiloniellales bacterium]|nr:L-histidine N(alpha)-methyltransferase [Kiloniellales bacterium]
MRSRTAEIAPSMEFHDLGHEGEDFRAAVLAGLGQPQKQVPAKFFYDAQGSRLFDRICELEAYYPTRTEIGLLRRHAGEIAEAAGPEATLVEFGSGSSRKVRILLEALQAPAAYVPIDISRAHLMGAAQELAEDYPGLPVHAVCADYTRDFALPQAVPEDARLGFFPGSTLGNFAPAEAARFLRRIAGLVGTGGGLLIGIDLQKDEAILHAAYNDPEGVTAAFNLNLLARMRQELGAELDLEGFRHEAHYNRARGCIEMHLVSRRRQRIVLGDCSFDLEQGETIHTEDSRKYSLDGFRAQAQAAGWRPLEAWVDDRRLFSLHYLVAA